MTTTLIKHRASLVKHFLARPEAGLLLPPGGYEGEFEATVCGNLCAEVQMAKGCPAPLPHFILERPR